MYMHMHMHMYMYMYRGGAERVPPGAPLRGRNKLFGCLRRDRHFLRVCPVLG